MADAPLPVADELTAPFWEAARDGRLAVQRCGGCGRYSHPPVALCPGCASTSLAWVDVSGRGVVHARVVVHAALVAGFEADLPYVGLAVELAEQRDLILLARAGADADVRIGDRVRVRFERVGGDVVLPQFAADPFA